VRLGILRCIIIAASTVRGLAQVRQPRAATADSGPLAAVQLGARRVFLPSSADSFPRARAFRDTTHEGANTLCLSVGQGEHAALLVLDDEDIGLWMASLTTDSSAYHNCPHINPPVRLFYDGRVYDLSTSLATIQRRLGPPTLRGDTLTWGTKWTRTIRDAAFNGGPQCPPAARLACGSSDEAVASSG
jgi:hypothetical protein